MAKIGFKEAGGSFKHKDTRYYVEFLSPPLSVGEEPVKVISSIEEKSRVLKLISPTDCVKDRLAAYTIGVIDKVWIRLFWYVEITCNYHQFPGNKIVDDRIVSSENHEGNC